MAITKLVVELLDIRDCRECNYAFLNKNYTVVKTVMKSYLYLFQIVLPAVKIFLMSQFAEVIRKFTIASVNSNRQLALATRA